jgi:uncharacterized delta-60 repeat protein
LLLACVAALAGTVVAGPPVQAGVDSGFGTGGRFTETSVDRIQPAVRPDGRIVGTSVGLKGPDKVIVNVTELSPQGRLTTGFGGTGQKAIDTSGLPGADDELSEPAGTIVLPNGTVVVQVVSSIGATFLAVRPDGTLDPAVNGDGFLSEQFVRCGKVTGLVRLADGGFASVSHELPANPAPPCQGTILRRYDANLNRVPFGNQAQDNAEMDTRLYAQAIAVTPSGALVAAGVTENSTGVVVNQVGVARYTAAGNPDTAFSGDGLAVFDPAPSVPFAYYGGQPGLPRLYENKAAVDVAIDSAGRALVLGSSARVPGGNLQVWVARLDTAGNLDPSYGTGGIAWADVSASHDYALNIDLDAAGRAVVSGTSRPVGQADPANRSAFTVRLTTTGAIDDSPTLTKFGTSLDHVAYDQVLSGNRAIVGGLAGNPFVNGLFNGFIGAIDLSRSTPPTADPAFQSVSPVRVLDTRKAAEGPALAPGSSRTIDLSSLVPAGATGVAVNVTLAGSSDWTYLTTYPAGGAVPRTSVVNGMPGQVSTNGVVVGLGTNRSVSVYNQAGDAHVVVDLLGWFTPRAGFNAVAPVRLVNTIDDGAAPLAAGSSRRYQVTGVAVPSGAKAVAVNLTAINPSEATYLTAGPDLPEGSAQSTSLVNPLPGETRANATIVGLDAGGGFDVFNANGQSDLALDILGWFDGSGGFVAMTPERPVPTVILGPGETKRVPVLPAGVAPSAAGAVSINLTAAGVTEHTFITVWPDGDLPLASMLNPVPAMSSSNSVVVSVGSDGMVNLYNPTGGAAVIVDVLGWLPR